MDKLTSTATAKRVFDLTVTLVMAPLWVPVCLMCALALRVTAGAPVIYRSERRVVGQHAQTVTKFRTMVRNADRLLNRETVPITGTCFLNIPPDHPVYTPVGRVIERFALTELPQLLDVLKGSMSLVGNRPLPENVVHALVQLHPHAEDRFLTRGGLTGPVQLVGRDHISDEDRLAIEIDYCLLSLYSYRWRVDALILINTVMVALKLRRGFTASQVRALLADCLPGRSTVCANRRQTALRFRAHRPKAMFVDGHVVDLNDFGYRGIRVTGALPFRVKSQLNVQLGDTATSTAPSASVRWSRQLSDGRFESGLSLPAGSGWAQQLAQHRAHRGNVTLSIGGSSAASPGSRRWPAWFPRLRRSRPVDEAPAVSLLSERQS
jgi:lipopolysaccharide/colanic/teichoic acid biosynthesis glycosyltransferase